MVVFSWHKLPRAGPGNPEVLASQSNRQTEPDQKFCQF